MKNEKTYELVLMALFTAIIVIMAFTPLGYIPLVVINATIIHIPVILGALFLGPKKGAFLGFVFGFTSFINNTFKAVTPSAFVFSPVLAANVVGVSGIFKPLHLLCAKNSGGRGSVFCLYRSVEFIEKREQGQPRRGQSGGIRYFMRGFFRISEPDAVRQAERRFLQRSQYCRRNSGGCDPVRAPDHFHAEESIHQYCSCLCGACRRFHQYPARHERYLHFI